MKTNPEEPINPVVDASGIKCTGLTKREYFAAMAMQGELSSQDEEGGFYQLNKISMSALAEKSVMAADALIEELNKE